MRLMGLKITSLQAISLDAQKKITSFLEKSLDDKDTTECFRHGMGQDLHRSLQKVECPICAKFIDDQVINIHIDSCLNSVAIKEMLKEDKRGGDLLERGGDLLVNSSLAKKVKKEESHESKVLHAFLTKKGNK